MRYIISLFMFMIIATADEVKPWAIALKNLTPQERHVIVDKGTQRAFSGKYVNSKEHGTYTCKVCDTPLYKSDDKFDSHCGWPSFDDAIEGAIRHKPDADGYRIEILCAKCDAHLGHIFKGEGLTKKNIRHCVNSISLNFDKIDKNRIKKNNTKKAYFAGGCFWGVEYYLESLDGVTDVRSGFMGGTVKNPSYHDVIGKDTGHLETVEVVYDTSKISFETIAKAFFEIHDPTQTNGQGPDIGPQYISAIFVNGDSEQRTIKKLIKILEKKGLSIATKIRDKSEFYTADASHQDYYKRKGTKPYCHAYIKRF